MIAAAIRKDLHLVLADRGGLMALFAMPVVFMIVFGAVFADDRDRRQHRIAVSYDAGNEAARTVGEALATADSFDVERLSSADAARQAVAEGRVLAAVIVPAAFDPAVGVGVELCADRASLGQTYDELRGRVQGLVARASFGLDPDALLWTSSPPGAGEPVAHLGGFQLAVPGNAVLFGFFLALTIAISFLDERQSGTLRRLAATPVARWRLLLAKLVPYLLVGLVQLAFLFTVGCIALGLEVGGSWLALCVLSVAVVVCATTMGLLIASFSGTQKQVGGVGSIALLVMGLMGGAMIPRLAMPGIMKTLGLATPHAWALDGYYELLLRRGTGIADVAVDVFVLLGFSFVFAVVGAIRFRFDR